MVAIVTRAGKGSPLTNAEVDANFVNLNNGKLETSNNLSDLTNAATARTNLGLGTLATLNSINNSNWSGTALDVTKGGTGATDAATARTNLGVAIGSNVQAWDADLDAIAALAGTAGLLRKTAANTWSLDTNSYLTGNQSITFSGDATGSGTTSVALTLAASGVTAGTYTKVTVDAKGRVTTGASLASGDLPTYTGTLTSGQVTTALGFTPYNSTNPSGYITQDGNARLGIESNGTLVGTRRRLNFIPGTGISLSIADDSANEEVDVTITSTVTAPVTSVFGRTGAVTLTSSDVTTALGYTPYNSSNPNGYITSSSLSSYLPLSGSSVMTGMFQSVQQNSSMASSNSDASLEISNAGGTGDGGMAMMRFHCRNYFGIKLGLRSDGYFGLGGWSASTWRWYVDPNGNMTAAGNVTAYSDERLKTDWSDLPADFIEQLARVKHGTYTRIDSGERQAGASAQQMRALLSEVVTEGGDADKTLTLAYGNAALVSAIQLAQRVVELTARLHALEQKMGA